jgi:glutamine synthetase
MANMRFKAIETAHNRTAISVAPPSDKVADYYGSYTFSDDIMKTLLTPEAYHKVSNAIKSGSSV